jgi:hypothetical protein
MDKSFALDQYKPQVSVAKTFEVDETLPDKELTFDVFKKLVLARKIQDAAFLSIGHMLKIIRDRKLFTFLDFENFGQFLADENLSFSREKAYMYIRIYEYYIEGLQLNEEVMRDLPIARLSLMLPVLKKIEGKEAQMEEIERMKALRHNDFVREIKSITNTDGKPNVFFSEEAGKWIVQYFENTTHLISLGQFEKALGGGGGETTE